ncbi:MAG: DEAD/DEAH box helicase family protein [Nitrososphaerales archaeon]
MTSNFVPKSLHANRDSPLEYLAEMSGSRHIAVLYENEKRAIMMQYWYIIHGLAKGQHCIYTTHDDVDKVRSSMKVVGVDVEYYEKERGLLHIRKIDSLKTREDSGAVNQLITTAFEGAKPPFRLVVRLFDGKIKTEDESKLCVEVESAAQEGFTKKAPSGNPFTIFSGYQGSMMCHYPVEGAGLDLISKLMAAHDATVFVPKSGDMKLVYTTMDGSQENSVK